MNPARFEQRGKRSVLEHSVLLREIVREGLPRRPGTASKGISEAVLLRQFKSGHSIQRDRFTLLLRTVELADVRIRHPGSMAQVACEPALVQTQQSI